MYWVAGHADIKPNEMVDGCAKLGAKQAQAGRGMSVATAIRTGCFLPPGQAPYLYDTLIP